MDSSFESVDNSLDHGKLKLHVTLKRGQVYLKSLKTEVGLIWDMDLETRNCLRLPSFPLLHPRTSGLNNTSPSSNKDSDTRH